MSVPRFIFQTARSFDEVPVEQKASVQNIRELNPDWSYRFYDDDEVRKYLRQKLSQEEWQLLEEINPKYGVILADIFRYVVIYNEGGVYIDIKSGVSQSLSKTIPTDTEFIISQWSNRLGEKYVGYGLHPELSHIPGGEFQQWCIVARARHPYLKAVIKEVFYNIKTYSPSRFGADAYGVLRLSGPIAYTRAIYPVLDHFPHSVTDLNLLGVFYSIYDRDGNGTQTHQASVRAHYSTIREPLILRERYTEPVLPMIERVGDLLATELRQNTELVLKLAVISIASTATFFVLTIIFFVLSFVR